MGNEEGGKDERSKREEAMCGYPGQRFRAVARAVRAGYSSDYIGPIRPIRLILPFLIPNS